MGGSVSATSPDRGRRGADEARQSSRAISELNRAVQGSEQGYLLGGRARLEQLQLKAPASTILSLHRHGYMGVSQAVCELDGLKRLS